MVLTGNDLDALSDDPDELADDLQALAGPSAGPNGGQIYIDGFTGGQLPPKSSIREIRINQNPFSAEYDKLGYGRIEIFTKPGTDQYHGQISVVGNSSYFNSTSPFATIKHRPIRFIHCTFVHQVSTRITYWLRTKQSTITQHPHDSQRIAKFFQKFK